MSLTATILKTERRTLPCPLTNDELLAKGDALATALRALDEEREKQDTQKAAMKERVAEITSRIAQLRTEIQERREFRDVAVDIVIKDRLRAIVTEVRQDSGEVVQERFMDDDERQQKLPDVH